VFSYYDSVAAHAIGSSAVACSTLVQLLSDTTPTTAFEPLHCYHNALHCAHSSTPLTLPVYTHTQTHTCICIHVQYSQSFDHLASLQPQHGLYPEHVDPRSGALLTSVYKLGASVDSFYEYALKLNLQSRGREPQYRAVYDAAVDGAVQQLLKKVSSCDVVLRCFSCACTCSSRKWYCKHICMLARVTR
jgi:Glycosyl hydrolase family 47